MMSKQLLIVESPAKAVTLKKFLGSDFEVKASVGHVMDLPVNKLGVDLNADFKPQYEIIKGKEKIIRELKQAAKKVDNIYLAPDPDREGEAIAWHIAQQIEDRKKHIFRVLFHELTKKGITEAMENPGYLNQSKYESQQTRRILDRLVGYQISPLLWGKVRTGLSAGRVQSVAVRLIVERERRIQAFEPQEYWSITALLQGGNFPAFEADVAKYQGKTLKISHGKEAGRIEQELRNEQFHVFSITRKQRQRKPEPPFKTSTLQQEAYRKLGFAAKKTMTIAQMLYEGVEVGAEGQVGLITYMRTDSTRVSAEAQREALAFVGTKFGRDFVPPHPNIYKNQKNVQDAHEAVRPTSVYREPESIKAFLTKDQFNLYKLVWERFLASQMKAALIEQTSVDITAGDYLLRAVGSIIRFPGFMVLYVEGTDEEREDTNRSDQESVTSKQTAAEGRIEDEDPRLPPLKEGERLELKKLTSKQHFTKAPPRFTEATLVKELEEKGIGRPSTYASILSNVQDRKYVIKDKRVFYPTELGYLVNDLLVENFPEVLNVSFTAKMEENLDDIEEGKASWTQVLKQFYDSFSNYLERASKTMRNSSPTDVRCEKCGNPMAIKWGKNGPFLACSGYPECKNTKNYERDEKGRVSIVEEKISTEVCPNCASPLVVKKGRFGPFLACSAYPQCKYTKALKEEDSHGQSKEPELTGELCPKCGGRMLIRHGRGGKRYLACENSTECKNVRPLGIGVRCPAEGCDGEIGERVSQKGRHFYGCSRYPACKFVSWYLPVNQPCPECGSSYLVKKETKRDGTHLSCPQKGCNFKQPLISE
jgi:DNA topoisomerase-1